MAALGNVAEMLMAGDAGRFSTGILGAVKIQPTTKLYKIAVISTPVELF